MEEELIQALEKNNLKKNHQPMPSGDGDKKVGIEREMRLIHEAKTGSDDIDMIEMYIKDGDDVNAKDNLGNTALHYTASSGSPKKTKLLIDNEANMDVQNNEKFTPLHYAVFSISEHSKIDEKELEKNPKLGIEFKKKFAVLEVLSNYGVDCTITDCDGYTPIDYFRNNDYFDKVEDFGKELESLFWQAHGSNVPRTLDIIREYMNNSESLSSVSLDDESLDSEVFKLPSLTKPLNEGSQKDKNPRVIQKKATKNEQDIKPNKKPKNRL